MAITATDGRGIRVKCKKIVKRNIQDIGDCLHALTLLFTRALDPFNELHIGHKLNGNMRCICKLFVRMNSLAVIHSKRKVCHRFAYENIRPADRAVRQRFVWIIIT